MSRVVLASGDTLVLDTRDAIERFQPVLKRAHGRRGRAYCLCKTDDRVPVTIVKLKRGETEHYTLRTNPGKKMSHEERCDFTTLVETPSRARGAEPDAPRANLRIEGGIEIRDLLTEADEPPAAGDTADARGARAATRLLDVAKTLWERALLDRLGTRPEKRNWMTVAPLLLGAASDPIRGGVLRDIFAVVVAGGDPAEIAASTARFDQVMRANREQNRRVLIVGELGGISDVREHKQRTAIFLKGMQTSPWRVLWDQRMIDSTRRRFRIAASLAGNQDARVIAIMTGEVDRKGANMVDVHICSLMALSREFIPVESSHELRLARMMAAARRGFIKPRAPRNGVLPDFLLTDCGEEPIAIEVYGMNTPEYLQNKDRKRELYQELGVSCWEWDALAGPPQPLPPAQRGA